MSDEVADTLQEILESLNYVCTSEIADAVSESSSAVGREINAGTEDVASAIRDLTKAVQRNDFDPLPSHCDRFGDEQTHTERRILQLVPAQKETHALYKDEDGKFWREPVVAWGLWDEWDETRGGRRVSRRRREAGPLVLVYGHLSPAADTSNFAGVRYGSFVEVEAGGHHDTPDLGIDPFQPKAGDT
jgi:hypothetical protein